MSTPQSHEKAPRSDVQPADVSQEGWQAQRGSQAAANAAHGWPTDAEPPALGSAWGTAANHDLALGAAAAEMHRLWDELRTFARTLGTQGSNGFDPVGARNAARLLDIISVSRARCGL